MEWSKEDRSSVEDEHFGGECVGVMSWQTARLVESRPFCHREQRIEQTNSKK